MSWCQMVLSNISSQRPGGHGPEILATGSRTNSWMSAIKGSFHCLSKLEKPKIKLRGDIIWFKWMNTLRSDYVWEDRYPNVQFHLLTSISPRAHTHTLKKRSLREHIWVLTSQVKWSNFVFQLLQLEHKSKASAILLPKNISTTKVLSVDKPTKSQLTHWNSEPSSTRETLLLISIEPDYQSGCSRFRMWDVSFSGFDQRPSQVINYWLWDILTHISI